MKPPYRMTSYENKRKNRNKKLPRKITTSNHGAKIKKVKYNPNRTSYNKLAQQRANNATSLMYPPKVGNMMLR